jgi:para-aminobenzoate synthetase component 1
VDEGVTLAPVETVEVEYWENSAARLHSFAARPWFVLLDSCCDGGAAGRFDIAAWDPVITLTTYGDRTVITEGSSVHEIAGDPFVLVQSQLSNETQHAFLPFVGGAIGMFGYDLGRRVSQGADEASRDIDFPDMAVGLYTHGLVVDHQRARAWFFHRGLSAEVVQTCLRGLSVPRTLTPAVIATDFVVTSAVRPDISLADYAQAFTRIQRYLRDGDCYQVNYAQRFTARAKGNPWDAYLRLRSRNSAPYAAFMRVAGGAVLSSSPERFIEVRGRAVESKPIKGTRARAANAEHDREQAQILATSAKDRAENLMIVDLLRNDIGKTCVTGSVVVPHLFEIESFTRVHHLVSTVRGSLPDNAQALDVLRGCFPGGSITGVPKRRAMEIIEELEPTRRNVYCGAIGYLSHDGQMDTNIAIRTLLFTAERLFCWAGGGIVIDSVLEDEYQESLDKAAAMLSVFSDAEDQNVGR